MSSTVLAAQVRARLWLRTVVDRVRESEFGQGAAEYAGIVVVALAIVAVIAGVLKGYDFKTKITNALNAVFGA